VTLRSKLTKGLATLAGIVFLSTLQDKVPEMPVEDRYAVLISGDKRPIDIENLAIAYDILKELDYHSRNIYVLAPEKSSLPSFYKISTKENIKELFDLLFKTIDSRDLLFVYATDHGVQEEVDGKMVSSISLPEDNMNELELEEILSERNTKYTVVLMDICYGGGFAQRLSYGSFVGISSSSEEQVTFGDTGSKVTFGRHFMEAHQTLEADLDGDERVNVREAFEYAQERTNWNIDGRATPYLLSEHHTSDIYLAD